METRTTRNKVSREIEYSLKLTDDERRLLIYLVANGLENIASRDEYDSFDEKSLRWGGKFIKKLRSWNN